LSFISIRLSLNEKNKERQAQGIVLAKENGKFKGGKPKFSENDPRLQLAFKLYLDGRLKKMLKDRQVSIAGLFKGTEKI
jgi:DNA invertase Pin-like site-specific DNA recombinase